VAITIGLCLGRPTERDGWLSYALVVSLVGGSLAGLAGFLI